jgi:hypothetical protein
MTNEQIRILIFFVGCIIISLITLPIYLGIASITVLVLLYTYINDLK